MKTRIFIENGEITLGKVGLRKLIESLRDGTYMVSAEEWKLSKTKRQNRGFHGPMLDAISEETGYHKHEAKFIVKDMFGEKRIVANRFTNEVKTELVSISEYTKEQMTSLISKTLMWMETDLGIVIDMKEKKKYCLDELTGELTELTT